MLPTASTVGGPGHAPTALSWARASVPVYAEALRVIRVREGASTLQQPSVFRPRIEPLDTRSITSRPVVLTLTAGSGVIPGESIMALDW